MTIRVVRRSIRTRSKETLVFHNLILFNAKRQNARVVYRLLSIEVDVGRKQIMDFNWKTERNRYRFLTVVVWSNRTVSLFFYPFELTPRVRIIRDVYKCKLENDRQRTYHKLNIQDCINQQVVQWMIYVEWIITKKNQVRYISLKSVDSEHNFYCKSSRGTLNGNESRIVTRQKNTRARRWDQVLVIYLRKTFKRFSTNCKSMRLDS